MVLPHRNQLPLRRRDLTPHAARRTVLSRYGPALLHQGAGSLEEGGADLADELRVRVGHRRHPVQLGGAGRLLLEVDQALQRLLISVECLTAGLLGRGQDLLVEFPDPLGGVRDVDSGAGCWPPGCGGAGRGIALSSGMVDGGEPFPGVSGNSGC